ncbi:MAG: hypothetical protein ACYC1I_10235 [Acidimicrobiales bacterium]
MPFGTGVAAVDIHRYAVTLGQELRTGLSIFTLFVSLLRSPLGRGMGSGTSMKRRPTGPVFTPIATGPKEDEDQ